MTDFFYTYPYMALSLILLGVFGFALLICPSHWRKPLLLSALISAPYGFASILFVPEYWKPVRLFEFFTGPEDIIFSFANGGTALVLGVWSVKDRIQLKISPKKIALHALGYVGFGNAFYIVFRAFDFGVMASAASSICVLGAVTLTVRRDLWPLAFAGAIKFGLLYFIAIKVCFVVFPEFISQWNHPNLWGPTALGVPIDELVWAVLFGGVWPMLMAWAFGFRFASERAPEIYAKDSCLQEPGMDT